ncbi:MAG TPA: hypothetical protein VFU13_22815 [Steroidobacteraceae bacterium]|nr:hypothetical protein [Steroidobacteraceae bacterium]
MYIGYGEGALAVLDPESLDRLGDIPLKGHPESFQLSPVDGSIYVNVPDAKQIAVVDRKVGRQIASWPATKWAANYPMAIDEHNQSVLSVFRKPARMVRCGVPTTPGSRTGLYSTATDVLFVAARAEGGQDAAVWVLKPTD